MQFLFFKILYLHVIDYEVTSMAVGAVEQNLFGGGLDAYLALQKAAPKTQGPQVPAGGEVSFPQGGATGSYESVPALKDPTFRGAIARNPYINPDYSTTRLGARDAIYSGDARLGAECFRLA